MSRPPRHDLREIAKVYNEVTQTTGYPSRSVAQRFGVTQDAARQLVRRARRDGLIPRANGNRPGFRSGLSCSVCGRDAGASYFAVTRCTAKHGPALNAEIVCSVACLRGVKLK